MPTAAQLRAARALLGLSRSAAAHISGLHLSTLAKAEGGDPTLSTDSLEALAAAYAARGVVWVGTSGIERRSP